MIWYEDEKKVFKGGELAFFTKMISHFLNDLEEQKNWSGNEGSRGCIINSPVIECLNWQQQCVVFYLFLQGISNPRLFKRINNENVPLYDHVIFGIFNYVSDEINDDEDTDGYYRELFFNLLKENNWWYPNEEQIAAGDEGDLMPSSYTEIEKDTWIDMCEHANDEYAIDYDSDMYWSFLDVNPNTTRILKKFTIADYNDAYVVEFPQYTRDDGNACLESALRLCEKLQKKLEEEKTKI